MYNWTRSGLGYGILVVLVECITDGSYGTFLQELREGEDVIFLLPRSVSLKVEPNGPCQNDLCSTNMLLASKSSCRTLTTTPLKKKTLETKVVDAMLTITEVHHHQTVPASLATAKPTSTLFKRPN